MVKQPDGIAEQRTHQGSSAMDFVPPGYRSHGPSAFEVLHHPDESPDFVNELASLIVGVADIMHADLGHRLSCSLNLCVYRNSDDAAAALGRTVPTTMLMAPRIGPDWSLIVCHSPEADPRNGDWRRMRRHLAHEFAHVWLADFIGGMRVLGDGGRLSKVRPWFDEGFAEMAAAHVCARPEIIERYLATPRDGEWNEDDLDATLNDIGSPRRPAAFAEAVLRMHARSNDRTLRDVLHDVPTCRPTE